MAAASTSTFSVLDDYGFKYETLRTREKIKVRITPESWFIRTVKDLKNIRKGINWERLRFRLRNRRDYVRIEVGGKEFFAEMDYERIRELIDEIIGWKIKDDDLDLIFHNPDFENRTIRILYVDRNGRKILISENEVIENPTIYEYDYRRKCWEVA